MALKMLHDFVMIKQDEMISSTSGGIVLAGSAAEQSNIGTVVSVGKGTYADNGVLIETNVAVGDRVVFSKTAAEQQGQLIEDGGEKFIIIQEGHIFGTHI